MKLSVCIPVYNVAPYVEKCARSLFAQTYADIEYIFVDDCTPDDSIDIVKRVLRDYPNRAGQVKFLRHENNRGLVAARKTAIRAATGDLLTHCDSDDWVDAELYGKMVARMTEADADAVICSTKCHYADRTMAATCPVGLDVSGKEAMRQMDAIPGLNSMWTKILRRDRVNLDDIEWPDDVSIAEDHCHMMQVLPGCHRLVGVCDGFYHYQVNVNSMSRSRNLRKTVDHQIRVFDILTRRVPGDEGIVPRRNLARSILFWGTVGGRFSSEDFRTWCVRYAELGGLWDWSDKSLWGQRTMKLARSNYRLLRLVSPFTRKRVDDYL